MGTGRERIIPLRFQGNRRSSCCALMILALYPLPACGADDGAILQAAERAASGTATPADEALLFIENKRMNHPAMEGKLDGETYRMSRPLTTREKPGIGRRCGR